MIGIILLAIVIIVVIVFVLGLFFAGKDLGGRKPWVIDRDSGTQGRFIKYTPGSDKDLVNVHIKPWNSNFWETEIIPNVPRDGIIEGISAPDPSKKGICHEGYIILTTGERGQARMEERIGSRLSETLNALRKKIRDLELDKLSAEGRADEVQEDIKSKIKELEEATRPVRKMKGSSGGFYDEAYGE